MKTYTILGCPIKEYKKGKTVGIEIVISPENPSAEVLLEGIRAIEDATKYGTPETNLFMKLDI